MKTVAVLAVATLVLCALAFAQAEEAYTIVPAGAAGPGLYLDKVGPLLEGSESLPVVARLPRIARQPLWAVYEIGEPITGGCKMYDLDGSLVRSSSILVELYRLTFYRQKAYYERIYRETARVAERGRTGSGVSYPNRRRRLQQRRTARRRRDRLRLRRLGGRGQAAVCR